MLNELGVETVDLNAEKNLVIVQGTMDGKALLATFKKELNLEAKVVEPKKEKKRC